MPTLVAQIAPQRSTQYADWVTQLAPHEIRLSALGAQINGDIAGVRLGTRDYLQFTLATEPDAPTLQSLAHLAMTDAYFHLYDRIGDVDGPLLKPLTAEVTPTLPHSLIVTRRYTGKTNELFTQFMVNVARYSSAYHSTPWHKLTLLDPLAGGGTTLFVGAVLGADVAGVEQDKKTVEGTVAFIKQYMKEARIPLKFKEDRMKNAGKRWLFTINESVRFAVGRGDTTDVAHFVNELKQPQLIVTDLPYGIQHQAQWKPMLTEALPAWAASLADGGALAFSWNATRLPRDEMIALVEAVSDFVVLDDPPYNQLGHRVDRVIKQRDVIVARRG
jgi:hypothetical protein